MRRTDSADHPAPGQQESPWRPGVVLRGVVDAPVETEPSVVDVFAAAGLVVDGSTPVPLPGELELAGRMGAADVRLEVPWARLRPHDPPSTEAKLRAAAVRLLEPYERLVDQALRRGLQPWITLYRHALPLSLMLSGGWLNRDTADRFGEVAAVVAERLGDRVAGFYTLEEPVFHALYGYAFGIEAPGLTLLGNAFPAVHHLLLGHAAAVAAVRAASPAAVGLLNHHSVVRPASNSGVDRAAAEYYDALHNRQFAGPIAGQPYPELIMEGAGRDGEVDVDALVRDGDLAAIAAPLDFYGVGYDHPRTVAAAPENARVPFTMVDDPALPRSEIGWPVDASALNHTLEFAPPGLAVHAGLHGYGTPAIEAGAGGEPADSARVDYLAAHLGVLSDTERTPELVWLPPLVDDWRGADGYTQRFGMVHLDPATGATRERASYADAAGRLTPRAERGERR